MWIALPALGILLASPAGEWRALESPAGGDVRALARDPRNQQTLYLGTSESGFYRSDDAGLSWRRLVPGLAERGVSIDEVEVGPAGEVYVGYWKVAGNGGGVARSEDGGRTFSVLPGIAGESVRALALAPSNPSVLVAGSLAGVFRSVDRGETWARLSPPGHAELRNVESVAIDPIAPDLIYAGTWHLPWKTPDAGRTWQPIHAGIIDDSDIFTLTLDRRSRETVYATACTGIYRSLDAGRAWAKFAGIPASSRRTRAFAQDPDRPELLYAGTTEGLWVSEDAGAKWRLTTSKDLIINAVLPLPGGTLLLGTDGAGVLRSGDRWRGLAASNQGFSARFVSRMAFDARNGRWIAATTGDRQHGGVWTAVRSEGPWVRAGDGLEGREVLSLAEFGDELVAGTDDGVFVSVSHCNSWRRLPTTVAGLDVHPRSVEIVCPSGQVLLVATSDGLLRSEDAGRTWGRQALGLARSISAMVARPSAPILAATALGIFRSDDLGATWRQVSQGFADAGMRSLAMLPGSDAVLFAATAKGLFKSQDGGANWYRRGGGLPLSDITGLALAPDGRTLYASDFSLGGIYQSQDAGENWTRFNTDGLVTDRVWAMALTAGAPATLLAALPGAGLHVWQPASGGLAAGR